MKRDLKRNRKNGTKRALEEEAERKRSSCQICEKLTICRSPTGNVNDMKEKEKRRNGK